MELVLKIVAWDGEAGTIHVEDIARDLLARQRRDVQESFRDLIIDFDLSSLQSLKVVIHANEHVEKVIEGRTGAARAQLTTT